MPQPNDLSRSLVARDQDSTIIAVVVDARRVIPERDANIIGPTVASGNIKAINQYVRLSALSGFTGIKSP